MTTQTTNIRTNTTGMRALIGAATASLALLGGALLWQARPGSEPTAPAVGTTIGAYQEGVAPMGGLAELYQGRQAAARAEAALEERIGGMAELYRAQARPRPVPAGALGVVRDDCGLDTQTRAC